MKLAGKLFAAAALAVVSLSPALTSADGHAEKAIKARKSLMQLYAWNLGLLGGMAKGAVEYDAEKAQAAANNLAVLVTMGDGRMWPQGTDSTAMPGKTRAKAEAWTTWPAIMEKDKAMREAAAKMAEVAGDGVEAIQANMKAVGGACGGCHKPYREEE